MVGIRISLRRAAASPRSGPATLQVHAIRRCASGERVRSFAGNEADGCRSQWRLDRQCPHAHPCAVQAQSGDGNEAEPGRALRDVGRRVGAIRPGEHTGRLHSDARAASLMTFRSSEDLAREAAERGAGDRHGVGDSGPAARLGGSRVILASNGRGISIWPARLPRLQPATTPAVRSGVVLDSRAH